jgi:hypothetical protein
MSSARFRQAAPPGTPGHRLPPEHSREEYAPPEVAMMQRPAARTSERQVTVAAGREPVALWVSDGRRPDE